jgi:GNAT superfamily N-acetyltransferase
MVFGTPNRQRQGVGRHLLKTLHDGTRGRGWEHSSLWTRVSNIPARSPYEHHGYVLTGDRNYLADTTEIVRCQAAIRPEPT